MKGLLYQSTSWSHDDGHDGGSNFFCVEHAGAKLHVIQGFSDWDESVRVVGPCDGNCTPMTELSDAVECAVKGHFTPVSWADDKLPKEVVALEEEPATEKMVAKINRWAKRYRWTRSRRLIADFS
jgi:hypothetical protein